MERLDRPPKGLAALVRRVFALAKRKGRYGSWVASRAGVTRQTASNWRLGRCLPRGRHEAALRDALGVLAALPDRRRPVVRRRPTPVEQFWRRVRRTRGCWLWTGGTGAKGFGVLSWHGRREYCHRVLLEIAGVEVPRGRCVRRSCGRRLCVRPDHLVVGTLGDAIRAARRRS